MIQRLVDTGRKAPAALRTIVYGGGPMYVDGLKKAMAAFGPVFAQIYGQGESPMTITGLRRADHELAGDEILGSVGYPRSGVEVAVLGQDGSRAEPGQIGEIVCRGDVVMSGYWNNPAATRDTVRQGWLYTGGDMGSFDDRGYLTLHDRSKDVVISGGSNIYPREVEEALLEHPDVAEAAWSVRRIPSGVRSSWRSSWLRRRRCARRPPARSDCPVQTAKALPLRRRPAQEQLRQGAQARIARPPRVTTFSSA